MGELKHISDLLDIKDIRSAVNDGYRDRRDYSTPPIIERPLVARFKMQVYFMDGNKRYFYSFDFHKPIHDEWRGLSSLIAQTVEWMDKIKTVSIYACLDNVPETKGKNYDTLIYRWWIDKSGHQRKKENPSYGFVNSNNRTVLRIK